MMIREHDLVKSTQTLDDLGMFTSEGKARTIIPKGTTGTVVMVLDHDAFLVEFFDENNETINVLTVSERDIYKDK